MKKILDILSEKISFENDDIADLEKYSKVISIEMYEYMCAFLKNEYGHKITNKDNKINYKSIVDFIKMDKRIKSINYIFLGTFDEGFKSVILTKYEMYYEKTKKEIKIVPKNSNYSNNSTLKTLQNGHTFFNMIETKKKYSFNVINYVCLNTDVFNIQDFKKQDEETELIISKLKKINKLRNSVMHFSSLMSKEILENMENMEALFLFLPEPGNYYFKSEIIHSINKRVNINSEVLNSFTNSIIKGEE